MADDVSLHVEFKNKNPIELLDLTASFMALGQAYEDFVADRGYDPIRGNVRLYVKELRSGSVIAELQAMLDQASFLLEHDQLFAAFLTSFDDIVKLFLARQPSQKDKDAPTRTQVERINQILEPVAKDGGAQLILQINGDVHLRTPNVYGSQEANTVQNRIRKYLGPDLPRSQTFQYEPLTVFQVRDDPKGQAGDRGIIEKFSEKPIRLHFANEEAKRQVLDVPENPLRRVFFIDGEVSWSGGKPAVYKIYCVHDSEEKETDS